MSKHDFMHGTPHDIELFIDFYDKRVKSEAEASFERMKYASWLNGLYVRLAVASVFSKKGKYPKEPYGNENATQDHIEAREDMSDEEKEQLTQMFFDNLLEMQDSFNNSKKATGEGE